MPEISCKNIVSNSFPPQATKKKILHVPECTGRTIPRRHSLAWASAVGAKPGLRAQMTPRSQKSKHA